LRGAGLGEISVRTAALHDPLLGEPETNAILDEIRSLHLKSPLAVGRVFISYAHKDATFVERLEEALIGRGIRVWRDVRDLVAGRIDSQLRGAMRQQSVVIIVLSAASVNSDWVEWEVETARQMEKETQQHMLCPIALDSAWESAAWSAPLRNQIAKYFVVDFSAWHEPEQFAACFSRLHAGLRASYRLR
jgi:TIR domain